MNINSINLLSNNFAGKIRIQNRTPLYEKDTEPKYKNFSLAIDTVAFSKPLQRKKETVTDILKDAKIGNRPRFTADERRILSEELRKFSSGAPTTEILKEVLKLEYNTLDANGNKKKLSPIDIANFFSVMNEATIQQIKTMLNLMRYELKEDLVTNSKELDEYLFLPVENNPDLLIKMVRIDYKNRELPVNKRSELISTVMDILRASDYKYTHLSYDIATVVKSDKNSFALPLLVEATKSCTKREFKQLLATLTPEESNKLQEKYSQCNSSIEELDLFDKYIEDFKKTKYVKIKR